jgi:[ribosomal protein S5]-alanine N-acetyltransferase
MPRLTAPGIVLRPLVAADAPALFVALSDPQVQLYRRAAAHADITETEAYVAETLARSRAAWAITEDGGEALGRLALRVPEPKVGEFGIVIRAAMHRRGLGLRALALAESYAFTDLALDTLRADIDAENLASQALFARAGFARTDLIAAHRITKLGVRDSVIMVKHRALS